jgi:hypothetical protein
MFVEKDWHELMLVDETACKCTSNLDPLSTRVNIFDTREAS